MIKNNLDKINQNILNALKIVLELILLSFLYMLCLIYIFIKFYLQFLFIFNKIHKLKYIIF